MSPEDWVSLLKAKYRVASGFLRDVLYGLTVHEMDIELRKEKSHINDIFMLVVFGDFIGLPLLPPYYAMRLLPYVVPRIDVWKRQLLRERDITDLVKDV